MANIKFSDKNKKIIGVITALIVLSALGTVIYSAIQLPIYPDEVAYKIFLERFFLNGGYKQSVTPYCTSGFMVRPSLILLPAASFWSLLRWMGNDWESYRILPLLTLTGIILMLVMNSVRRKAGVPWPAILLIAVGPTIYGLLILRPEIFILFGGLVTFFLCRSLLEERSLISRILISILILFFYSTLVYLHPKAIYLSLLLLTGFLLSSLSIKELPRRLLYASSMMLLALWITLSAVNLQKIQFLTCPEVPQIQTAMSKQAVNFLSIFNNLTEFKENIKKILNIEVMNKTVSQLSFNKKSEANYLPPIATIGPIEDITNKLNLTVIALALIGILLSILLGFRALTKKENLLIATLAFCFLLPVTLSITRHWYDISFFAGSLMIMAGLYSPVPLLGSSSLAKTISASLKCLWGIIVSLAAILSIFTINQNITQKLESGYSGPGIPIRLNRDAIKTSVGQLLSKYKIGNDEPLIIDDLTYDILKNRRIIMPVTYISLMGDQPGIIKKALKKYNIKYEIVRCSLYERINNQLGSQLIETMSINSDVKICIYSINYTNSTLN